MSNLSHTFFCEPSRLSYVTFSGQVFSWTSHTNLRAKLNILTIFFFSFYQSSDVLKSILGLITPNRHSIREGKHEKN